MEQYFTSIICAYYFTKLILQRLDKLHSRHGDSCFWLYETLKNHQMEQHFTWNICVKFFTTFAYIFPFGHLISDSPRRKKLSPLKLLDLIQCSLQRFIILFSIGQKRGALEYFCLLIDQNIANHLWNCFVYWNNIMHVMFMSGPLRSLLILPRSDTRNGQMKPNSTETISGRSLTK